MSQPPNPPENGGDQPNSGDNSWQQQPPPQQPYQQQPPQYQQQPYQQQPYPPQPPKKSGKTAIFLVIGLIVACCVIGGVIFVAVGGDDKATVSEGSDNSNGDEKKADSGPAFKGKTDRDVAVNAGATVTKDKVAVTATKLTSASGLSGNLLCATVTIKNDGRDQQSFNPFDWTVQDPDGSSVSPAFEVPDGEKDLKSGEVAPGGKASGMVCFEGDASEKPGEYVLLYDNDIFSNDRYAWVNKL